MVNVISIWKNVTCETNILFFLLKILIKCKLQMHISKVKFFKCNGSVTFTFENIHKLKNVQCNEKVSLHL